MSEAEKRERIAHYVQLVGLRGFEKSYPRELSGGMKQRLEVARALAVNPDVLYLDEPFGALDSITRLQMRRELLRIWQAEQKTILFVTHDIEESVQLADRVVVLSARPGRVRRIVDIDIPHPRDLSRSALHRAARRDLRRDRPGAPGMNDEGRGERDRSGRSLLAASSQRSSARCLLALRRGRSPARRSSRRRSPCCARASRELPHLGAYIARLAVPRRLRLLRRRAPRRPGRVWRSAGGRRSRARRIR